MIPIFFHVPKCAGTYAVKLQLELIRAYRNKMNKKSLKKIKSEPGRNIEVVRNGKIVSRIIAIDIHNTCYTNPTFIKNEKGLISFKIKFENLNRNNLDKLKIISLVIEPDGFRSHKKILEKLNLKDIKMWILLRDPFEVARSMYYYLNSEKSSHEPTHGLLNFSSFEDYIKSPKLPDSWVIKSILNLTESSYITEKEYCEAIGVLEKFEVFSHNQVDHAINKIFKKCHNIVVEDIPNKPKSLFSKLNESNHKNIQLEDLDKETQQIFTEKTKFDSMLYEYFCKREIYQINQL